MKEFANSGTLFRFSLKRSLTWISLWIVGIVFLTVVCAPLLVDVAKSPEELAMYAETMKNPVMLAMCGPMYAEPYTYGVMYTQMMTVWMMMLMGAMNFFLVSQHTRRDEEEGKIEVLRSLPVGRDALLFSTWLTTILANLTVGLLCGGGLALTGIEDMGAGGCFLFGGILFSSGLLFAAVGMLFSQLCATSRGMLRGSFLVMGAMYALGAMGNISDSALSYASPFSFVFKAKPFAGDHILPVIILLAVTVILAAAAVILSSVRDLGAGMIPPRKGRAHASVSFSTPFGLALRLTKNTIIAWIIVVFVCGAMYGSIFGDFEGFIDQSDMFRALMQIDGAEGSAAMTSFMTYVTLIMSLIAAIPVLNVAMKLRSEERKNRVEPIYSRAVSKTEYFVSFAGVSFVFAAALQLSQSLGLWLSSGAVMSEPFTLSDTLLAGLIKLPGMWLLTGLGLLLMGLLPRLTSIVWVYFGLSFFAVYLGRLMNLPEWLVRFSAFGALPDYPVDEFRAAPVIIVTAIAVALAVAGAIAYSKREVRYN